MDWSDEDYPWEPDASAFTVLMKILRDGYIRSGWSFRSGKATIYGPYSAVCFTEMPLYALLDYVQKRSASGLVDTYAIAVRRTELFAAGGRPVIYGLSGPALLAHNGDPESGLGYKSLRSTSLPLDEQYRYVATTMGGGKQI
jgi:hypothetical protein